MPASVQRNGTLFADFFLVRDGARLESSDPSEVVHVRKLLTRYLPEKRARVERNLLTAADGPVEPVVEKPLAIVSHWYSNLTMVLLSEPSIGASGRPLTLADRPSAVLAVSAADAAACVVFAARP